MLKLSSKKLFYVSLFVILYFALLWINVYIIRAEYIVVGVVRESLTIPMLTIQLVLFFISLKYCINEKFKIATYSFVAFTILAISNIVHLVSIVMTYI